MKVMKHLSFFLLFLFASSSLPAREYETVAGDLTKTRIYTLDNGLKVYLSVNKEKPRIQTYVAVRTGSKNDPAETTGLAHYLEHLMFKGSEQFGTTDAVAEAPLLADIEQRYESYRRLTDPAARKQAYHEIDSVSQLAARYFIPNEYDKLMAAIGAQGTNAFTSNDVTCYTENIPSNEVENWARIQADRFQHMVIRGFHTELEAVYEEYNIYLTDDGDKVWNALGKKLTPTHPYGTQTTIGTQEHLKNPSITNIKNYFHRWYVPNNVAICMAGDFDPDQVIAIIERYFGQWKPAADVSQPVFPVQRPLTAPADTTVIGQQTDQVWVGWLAKKSSDLQCDTLEVIESMLSNGRAGIFDLNLNQNMRVQTAGAAVERQQDYSYFLLIGQPKPGQTLDEVRSLMLAELDNLKQGRFPDDLLPSVINNQKLSYQQALDNNNWRVRQHLESFISGQPWPQHVDRLNRISHMTKEQIIDFARRFFTDGRATVFKHQGVDSLQKKIDKPAITPIPTNRDQVSQFVVDIQNTPVEPIQPQFLDFSRDLTVARLQLSSSAANNDLPLIYKHNDDDGLFNLTFRYEFGNEDDNRYDIAAGYLDYVGTDRLSAAEVKQQFYKLACNYSVNVNADNLNITLTGLSENMAAAVQLLEDVLRHARGDKDSYEQYVGLVLKGRADAKLDQRTCFQRLFQYGVFGPHNSDRDLMSADQLHSADPQQLLGLLASLGQYEHSVLYYGPLTQVELAAALAPHTAPVGSVAVGSVPVPQGQPYVMEPTPSNEILLAPYDAKNIYLRMYHNEGRDFTPDEAAVQTVFNEYYGGGMNAVVFQEMREARGLAYNAFAAYMRPGKKGQKECYITHIITQNDKMMDCINQFHIILDQMPRSEAAFAIAKEAVTKQLASQRTTKFGVISAYLTAKRRGLDYDLNRVIFEQLPAVTLEDIARFEEQQMVRKAYRYILLGDEKELDMPALEKFGPVRRLTLEDIFGY